MYTRMIAAAATLLFAAGAHAQAGRTSQELTLKIGDRAPSVKAEKWVKGSPVTEFETGKVYVVEFWATWCPPCVKSIPHLTELQAEHKDHGLTIIGMTSKDPNNSLEAVETFVDEWGDKMNYTVAFDDGRLTNEAYMTAAGQRGIPTAFVVNKQGQVAWIGNPLNPEFDVALEKVVSGEHDITQAKADYDRAQARDKKAMEIQQSLGMAMQQQDYDTAMAKVDELIELDPAYFGRAANWKVQQLLSNPDVKDEAMAIAYAREAADKYFADDAQNLNGLAWTLLSTEGVENRGVTELAHQFAEKASGLTSHGDAGILDTLAKAKFELGDAAGAIKTQTKAVELADEGAMKEEMLERLNEYRRTGIGG